jgi:hypothetical protein
MIQSKDQDLKTTFTRPIEKLTLLKSPNSLALTKQRRQTTPCPMLLKSSRKCWEGQTQVSWLHKRKTPWGWPCATSAVFRTRWVGLEMWAEIRWVDKKTTYQLYRKLRIQWPIWTADSALRKSIRRWESTKLKVWCSKKFRFLRMIVKCFKTAKTNRKSKKLIHPPEIKYRSELKV